MELTGENIDKIMEQCLFDENEIEANVVKADGIVRIYGFHAERLEANRANIESMIDQLPDEFRKSSEGGGQSFLNMVVNNKGEQWTDLHFEAEAILCLGIAIGKIRYLLPRDLWPMLPGGMPYVCIIDKN